MEKTLIITVLLLFSTLAYSLYTDGRNSALDERWFIYKNTFNKLHADLMDTKRRMVWESNLKYIEKHNLDADLHKYSYHLGMNEFGDLTNKEFAAQMFPKISPYTNMSTTIQNENSLTNSTNLPASIDWQKRGYVTSVKSQKYCGCCAHMGAVGGYECAFSIKTKTLVSFSVQQMVNCVNGHGCQGAAADQILHVIKRWGIEYDSVIPYVGRNQDCIYHIDANAQNLTHYYNIIHRNRSTEVYAEVMKERIANVGPIIVTMNSSNRRFQYYKHGIFQSPECPKWKRNHSTVIVGYGSNYWRIKNSWGTWWGIKGYGFILKGENQCGIERQAIVVIA